ncbi:pilus assembly protein N-terminal domain-containing protein [Candidatus Margulisiibacteriota bacterium]
MKRYILLIAILFMVLNTAILCAEEPVTNNIDSEIAQNLDLIRSGQLSLLPGTLFHHQPTIQTIQEMLLSIKTKSGGPLYSKDDIQPGKYDTNTVEMVTLFQHEYMNFTDESPFVSYFGHHTIKTLEDTINEQKHQVEKAKVVENIIAIKEGGLLLFEDAAFNHKPTIQVIQDKLLSQKDPSTNQLLFKNADINPGMFDNKTVELLKTYQTKSMKMTADDPYLGILDQNTFNALERTSGCEKPVAEKTVISADIKVAKVQEAKKPVYSNESIEEPIQTIVIKKQTPRLFSVTKSQKPVIKQAAKTTEIKKPARLLMPEKPAKPVMLSQTIIPYQEITAAKPKTKTPAKPKNIITLATGASKPVVLPDRITNVAIGNPEVADTVIISSKEILINGKKMGNTTLTIWTTAGKKSYQVNTIKKPHESDIKVFHLKNIRLEYNAEGKGTSVVIKQDKDMAGELSKILSTFVPAEDFSINTRLNSITVEAPPSVIKKVESILYQLDEARRQIVIEAQIYEVKNTNDLDFKWQGEGQQKQFTSIFDNTSGGIVGWYNSGSAATALALQMSALIKEGQAKVLAKPRILAQDGRGSSILVGTKTPLVSTDSQGKTTVEYIEVGVILAITPRLVADNYIDTWFRTEVSNITAYTPAGYPEISSREAQSQARIKIGDTLVVGGLLKTNNTTNYVKIPILGDIPIIGQLFRNKLEAKEDSEIIVTLTPKLI